MTAIVPPLVRATTAMLKDAEHISAEISAELASATQPGAGLNEVEGAVVLAQTEGESPAPPKSLPTETFPMEDDLTETRTTEDTFPESLPTGTRFTETQVGDPDLWLYRDRTVGLLRRYLRLSVQVGRLPSLLGREFFRTRVTSYQVTTFEDVVIFVHDVERCLDKPDDLERKLIAKIVLQEYTQDEAARLLGCWRRTVGRRFSEALDWLSEIFLQRGLLARLPAVSAERPESCQEGKTHEISVSDSEQGK